MPRSSAQRLESRFSVGGLSTAITSQLESGATLLRIAIPGTSDRLRPERPIGISEIRKRLQDLLGFLPKVALRTAFTRHRQTSGP
jgi:hypothetical protein